MEEAFLFTYKQDNTGAGQPSYVKFLLQILWWYCVQKLVWFCDGRHWEILPFMTVSDTEMLT